MTDPADVLIIRCTLAPRSRRKARPGTRPTGYRLRSSLKRWPVMPFVGRHAFDRNALVAAIVELQRRALEL
jgi:hypothetical protein